MDPDGYLSDFINKNISRESLKGEYYETGYHTVHQAEVSFTPGQPPEDLIKFELS